MAGVCPGGVSELGLGKVKVAFTGVIVRTVATLPGFSCRERTTEMKSVIAAAVIILLACSTAFGGWGHAVPVVVPAPVAHAYWPVGPVYAYPSVVVSTRVVTVPRRIVYRAPVFAPAAVWHAPIVTVHPRVYVRRRPVRHALRAALPY